MLKYPLAYMRNEKEKVASVAIYLETRQPKQNGTCPVKIRVTFDRKQRYYNIGKGIDLTEEDYKKVYSASPRNGYKEMRIKLDGWYAKAEDAAKELKADFTFEKFAQKLFGATGQENTLFGIFEGYIQKLEEEGRATTAYSYRNALQSLKKFRQELQFNCLTPTLLNEYEKWMIQQGCSITTVGIYTRSLRIILNIALDRGLIKQQEYPFGKRGYQPPTGRNVKKALSLAQVEKIYSYPAQPGSAEDRARDFWLLSYLCNGLNMKDVCRLKVKNLRNDRIIFSRAKVERSHRSDPKMITAMLTPEARAIIAKWGKPTGMHDDFIFPILQPGISAKEEMALIRQFIKTTNKWLFRIGQTVGLELPLTSYSARHSFATVLKRSGAPVEFISESLGHSSVRTTANYLDSFEDTVKESFASQLLAFKKD